MMPSAHVEAPQHRNLAADERRLTPIRGALVLSAFICVHRRPMPVLVVSRLWGGGSDVGGIGGFR